MRLAKENMALCIVLPSSTLTDSAESNRISSAGRSIILSLLANTNLLFLSNYRFCMTSRVTIQAEDELYFFLFS